MLLRQFFHVVVQHGVIGVEYQLVAEGASSPLGKAHGSLVTGHGPARRPESISPRDPEADASRGGGRVEMCEEDERLAVMSRRRMSERVGRDETPVCRLK